MPQTKSNKKNKKKNTRKPKFYNMRNFKFENDYDEQQLNAYFQQELEENDAKEANTKTSFFPTLGLGKLFGKKEEVDSDEEKIYNKKFREELAKLKKEYGNLEASESEAEVTIKKKAVTSESESSDDSQFTVYSEDERQDVMPNHKYNLHRKMSYLGYDTRPKKKEEPEEQPLELPLEEEAEEEQEEQQEEEPEEPKVNLIIFLSNGDQFNVTMPYDAPVYDLKIECQEQLKKKKIKLEVDQMRLIHKGRVLEHDNPKKKKKTNKRLDQYYITDGLVIQLFDEEELKPPEPEEVVVQPAEEEEAEEEQEEEAEEEVFEEPKEEMVEEPVAEEPPPEEPVAEEPVAEEPPPEEAPAPIQEEKPLEEAPPEEAPAEDLIQVEEEAVVEKKGSAMVQQSAAIEEPAVEEGMAGENPDELGVDDVDQAQEPSVLITEEIVPVIVGSNKDQQAAPPKLNKEYLQKMPYNLTSVVQTLSEVFPKLEQGIKQDLVICIGNTGSGKSTLLNSFIEGVQGLKTDTVQVGSNGKRDVINQIDEVKQKGQLKIGHSNTVSRTFLPEFVLDDSSGLMYVDTAGLNDRGSKLVELVQVLLMRRILQQSQSVRFIVTFTHNQITTSRGAETQQILQIIQSICSGSGIKLTEAVQHMVPIVTRVKFNDDEVDIDELRSNFSHQSIQALKSAMAKHGLNINQLDEVDSDDDGSDFAVWKQQKEFFHQFAQKLEIFDPLDREIKGQSDENQAIGRSKLKQEIERMRGIEGRHLNAPVSNNVNSSLFKMFEQKEKECSEIAKAYIQESIEKGKNFKKKLSDNEDVVRYREELAFLDSTKLVHGKFDSNTSNIKHYLVDFMEKISTFEAFLKHTKDYKKMHQINQEIFDLLHGMVSSAAEKNYSDLVQQMIRVFDMIQEGQQNKPKMSSKELKERDKLFQDAQQQIQGIITVIAYHPKYLMQFAFELRKIDREGRYSQELLRGNVMPSILVDIILSNHWDDSLNSMVPQDGVFFRFEHGQHFLCFDPSNKDNKPQLLQNAQGAAIVQFKLCDGEGFKILMNGQELSVDAAGQVQLGQSEPLILGQSGRASKECSLFHLVPLVANSDEANFFIEHTYGDKRPRMVPTGKRADQPVKLIQMTLNDHDGYNLQEHAQWRISKDVAA